MENRKQESSVDHNQLDKFRDAARELGTNDDPERFAETVWKLAKAKPKAPAEAEEDSEKRVTSDPSGSEDRRRYKPRDPVTPLIWSDILEISGWVLAFAIGGALALYQWLS